MNGWRATAWQPYWYVNGWGRLSIILFVAGLVAFLLILFRRPGLRARLAFIVFALLPCLVAVGGAASDHVGEVRGFEECSVVIRASGELAQVIALGTGETIALLLLALVLLPLGESGKPRG